MVPAAVLVPCMVNFAFLHGSVPLCSTYRSGLGVPPGPSGKQLLSSREDISLDIKVAQNVSWCVVGCPHSLQATDTYHLWRSNKNYSHKPLRFFFFSSHVFSSINKACQNLSDYQCVGQEIPVREAGFHRSDPGWPPSRVFFSPQICIWLGERGKARFPAAALFSGCQWARCVGAKRSWDGSTTQPIN